MNQREKDLCMRKNSLPIHLLAHTHTFSRAINTHAPTRDSQIEDLSM